MDDTIDTGDTVFHEKSGEGWLVAKVEGNKLYWCGWPPGCADVSDCKLVRKATPNERTALLADLAKSGHDVAGWAKQQLQSAAP